MRRNLKAVRTARRSSVLWGLVLGAVMIAAGGFGRRAQGQTLLFEQFDDRDSAPIGWTVLFAVSATVTPTAAPTPTPTRLPPRENSLGNQGCHDDIDNDGDGLIDCRDPDCAHVLPCGAPVPALSSYFTAVLVSLLGLVGILLLSRRRQKESEACKNL